MGGSVQHYSREKYAKIASASIKHGEMCAKAMAGNFDLASDWLRRPQGLCGGGASPCGIPYTSTRRTRPLSGHLGVGSTTPCCSDFSVISLKLDPSKTGDAGSKEVRLLRGRIWRLLTLWFSKISGFSRNSPRLTKHVIGQLI